MRTILTGQVILVFCCISYLAFWTMGYRPGTDVNRIGGLTGVLLAVTAVLGISGIAVTVTAFWKLTGKPPVHMGWICLVGVIIYIFLLFLTGKILGRPVTTELFLINGWLVLELCVIDAAAGAGRPVGHIILAIIIVAVLWTVSMVLYMLYYNMEPVRAFYAAMVPLIAIGAGMGGCIACLH